MNIQARTPLGQILVEKAVITQEQLDIALNKQKETGELLGITLSKVGFVDEEIVLLPIIADQLGVDLVQLRSLEIDKNIRHCLLNI